MRSMIQSIGKSEHGYNRGRVAPLRSRTAALSGYGEGTTRFESGSLIMSFFARIRRALVFVRE